MPKWLFTEMEVEFDSSISSIKTIRDIVKSVADRKTSVSADHIWARLGEFLLEEIGLVPVELDMDRPIAVDFSTKVQISF